MAAFDRREDTPDAERVPRRPAPTDAKESLTPTAPSAPMTVQRVRALQRTAGNTATASLLRTELEVQRAEGEPINDDEELEREADMMGARAATS